MRIRMLAAAVVTAGALMATLTGAASADNTPMPGPQEGTVQIQCEGGGQATLTTRRLTEAEIKELEKTGSSPAAPAGRADEAGVPSGHVKVFRGTWAEGEDAKERLSLSESVAPVNDIKVMAAPSGTAAPGAPEAVMTTVISEDVPEGAEKVEGAKKAKKVEGAKVEVTRTASEGEPTVTCSKKD
ncbi:hypothetical protein ABZU75_30530 [Streptosporangium sp. NPDC005286]|uniref:hypothetical protein n=1 Tax=Streptosporangium sp. NPDC005286 TaxID=3154463 RepID=UPI0033B911E1